MMLPPKNSRQMAIIDTLRQTCPLSLKEGISLHGLPRKVTVADMGELYEDLVVTGCLVRVGMRYTVSDALLTLYAPVPAPEAGPLPLPVLAPTRKTFAPLDRRYLVSSRGQREGSNDLRAAPSLYGQPVKA
jgi:hypothetical protein